MFLIIFLELGDPNGKEIFGKGGVWELGRIGGFGEDWGFLRNFWPG
jgi:hypothetical protein